jgi:hypothetical protein
MTHVIGQLVPLALAAAISTVPISATVFILLSERRKTNAFPFLAGWVIGTAVSLLVAALLAEALPGRPRRLNSLIGDLELIVGTALVALGIVTLVRVRRHETSVGRPEWLETIGSFGALPAFGIGLALNVRPKSVLLLAAASLAIRAADLDTSQTAVAIAVYTAIATSTVVVPIVATALFPRAMEPRLLRARDWLTAHGGELTGAIMILVGLFVVVAGFSR